MKKLIVEAINNSKQVKELKRQKRQDLYLHAGMLLTLEEVKDYNIANYHER